MADTIYASFPDPSLAERAAGALFDHGLRSEDLSIISAHSGDGDVTRKDGYAVRDEPGLAGSWGAGGDDRSYRVATDEPGLHDLERGDNAPANFGDQSEQSHADMAATPYPHETVIGSPTYTAASDSYRDVHVPVDTDYVPPDDSEAAETEDAANTGLSTTTPGDAAAGAAKGAAWGLGLGTLAAVATLFVPGLGLVVGGGALAAAIGGVAAATGAGAAVGAVTGYLKDQGVDEHVAVDYEKTVHGGGAVIAVHVPLEGLSRERILEILDKYGATNVNAYGRGGGSDAFVS
jgi:uncharacterized membrane protein